MASAAIVEARDNRSAMLRLMRPHQWVKNALVLAALVFAKRMFVPHDLALGILGFIAFCALSSTAYVINDIVDREADRLNPEKRDRPIARGDVSVEAGRRLALALGAFAVILSAFIGRDFVGIVLLYAILQVTYSLWAKRVMIVDIIAVALGFVIRAFAGGAAIGAEVSPWLAFITFVLALLLVLGRRRHELIALGDAATAHRGALEFYSVRLIDQMISIVAGATLVGYMIYTASVEVETKLGTKHLYLTVPFVAFGILRYLYLIDERNEGGDPARLLLSDAPLMLSVILWILTDLALLYL
ncbi:MAG TPA: decaprenyl-phosphate phosphoribosyltransferase [Candidatus Binataceae bacterium]|nr:decaprenyl-phosphate phosphoribosyltransferase [Candidatus Binataceae bacterium]